MEKLILLCIIHIFFSLGACSSDTKIKRNETPISNDSLHYSCFYPKAAESDFEHIYKACISKDFFDQKDYWIVRLSHSFEKKDYLLVIKYSENNQFFDIEKIDYRVTNYSIDSIKYSYQKTYDFFSKMYGEQQHIVLRTKTLKRVAVNDTINTFLSEIFEKTKECLTYTQGMDAEIWTLESRGKYNKTKHIVSRANFNKNISFLKNLQFFIDACEINEYKSLQKEWIGSD